jgi:hypothetical protein
MAYGSLTLADLQATANASTVYEVGVDLTFEAIQTTMAAHNRILAELFTDLSDRTTDEARRYGGDDTMTMEDVDEVGVPRAQKITAGSNVGFPLNATMAAVQYTEMWFRKHTVAELAAQVNGVMTADIKRVTRDMKRALALATNYTFTDHLNKGVDIPVKRLVNADSAAIPPGPNGNTFTASSHTHYTARVSTLAASDVTAVLDNVKEHYASGDIVLYINQAQEASIRGFTSNFTPYTDARIVLGNASATIPGRSLDPVNYYNRAIGLFDGAEVVVKPWVPASYMFAFNRSAPKPLLYRYDNDYGDGLQLVLADGTPTAYPWNARGWRRIFGFGVWNRVNGAWLYTGATSWADPTIN